jgi:NurA-like 5'-3' nuclease
LLNNNEYIKAFTTYKNEYKKYNRMLQPNSTRTIINSIIGKLTHSTAYISRLNLESHFKNICESYSVLIDNFEELVPKLMKLYESVLFNMESILIVNQIYPNEYNENTVDELIDKYGFMNNIFSDYFENIFKDLD